VRQPLIAFDRAEPEKPREIWVMNADGSGQRALASGTAFSWSPDGSAIAFLALGNGVLDLRVVKRDGSGLRTLVSGVEYASPTWSPDSNQLAFSSTDLARRSSTATAIYVVNADGTGLARLTSPRQNVEDIEPAWSPDGTQIAFERDNFADDRFRFSVIVMNADGTSQRVLTPKSIAAYTPTWSRDSHKISFEGGTGVMHGEIYVMNRDGSNMTNLTRTAVPDDDLPQFSPDGKQLVFESYTNGRGKSEIHRIDANGTRHLNLTRDRGRDVFPSWTSDGRILFASSRDGNHDIYVMRPAGGRPTNLTNTATGSGHNTSPAWSP
jgi:Tol biopolymer transport system component